MAAPISVIIPCYNAADHIGPTLACLFEGLETGLIAELILSDGGSTDAIATLAEDLGARLITGQKSRGAQLALGAAQAKAPWLLFLHSDTVLSPQWSKEVAHHLQQTPSKAGYFQLRFDQPGPLLRLTAGWANLRARLFDLPFGDQALLIPRDLYEQIGGYPEIPLMEDVAIAQNLKHHLRPLEAYATTSARRYQQQGWLRRSLKNLLTQMRYLTGTSPEILAKSYHKKDP